jgi:hypothetical protein
VTAGDSIPARRLASNRLIGTPFASPVEVVRHFSAMQSQDYGPGTWGIGIRAQGVTAADVDALFDAGTILRTHVLRPTWHFVLPEDLRWLLGLTGPRVHLANGPYYRRAELDPPTLARGHAAFVGALEGGRQQTRRELAVALRHAGIEAEGLRLTYLVMHAELEGLICSGPRRGKQFTYALVDERVPSARPLDREEALAEIARRYVTSRGPAQAHDLAWWSGLTVGDSRRALELASDDLGTETFRGKVFWTAREAPAAASIASPLVRLLPVYDEYFIGFRDRADFGDPDRLGPDAASVLLNNIVVLDGMVVGGWRRTIDRRRVTITTDLLVPFGASERRALDSAAADFGRFLGLPVTLD